MGRARRVRPFLVCSALIVVLGVILVVLIARPNNRYGNTRIERNVAAFGLKCGYYDATHGITDYRGTFDEDPGWAGAYVGYGNCCRTTEGMTLIIEISQRDQAEQARIYKVFARAYNDGYDEGSTWIGRAKVKLRSILGR